MALMHLALGSNLGDRRVTLNAAVRRLRAEPGLRVVSVASHWETPPVGGPPDQPVYLNSALALETERPAHDILHLCQRIEHQFGRQRTVKDGPRTLDLDLLLCGEQIIQDGELMVPHPRMHERAFVLAPLAEIASDVRHPVLKMSIAELLVMVSPHDGVVVPKPAGLSDRFAGQRVLVTGSTSGIGLAIAELFEANGAEVLRHGSKLADLRDPAQIDRLAQESWGRGLDGLICNAGADTLTGERGKASFDDKLEQLLSIDVKGTMRLAREIGARMKARGHGCIITIGWDQAATGMEGDSGQLFAAVKSAVMGFSRSLAKSLAPEVRVNCIAPGWIRTTWGETASPVWQERVRRETPLGIWGLPDDIADAAIWLAGANFVTGQVININGGVV